MNIKVKDRMKDYADNVEYNTIIIYSQLTKILIN